MFLEWVPKNSTVSLTQIQKLMFRNVNDFLQGQVIMILQCHAADTRIMGLACKHGFTENILYTWKAEYGGMSLFYAKRLRELEQRTMKLRRLLAKTMLEKNTLNNGS